jgi:serine/threonine kinase PknH
MLFVSYASQDRAAIDNLLTGLRRAHEQVWVDEELGGGEAWWRTILEQIRGCEVFISALSNNSLASKPCQAELRYAEALQRPILPVQVGPVDSVRVTPLAATQILDYRNPTKPAGIQLIAAVQKLQAQVGPLPSPLPSEPEVPFAYLMRLATKLASPELSRHQQVELVSQLKARLDEDGNDPAVRRDIARLLCMLRDRPDVTWRTRTDIESVLAWIDAQSSTPSAGPVAPPSSGPQPVVAPPPFSGPQPVVVPPPGPNVEPADTAGAGGARRSRTRWLIGGGAGLAVLVAIVLTVVLARPGPPPGPLDSILLSEAEINTIMGASDMKTVEGQGALKQSSGSLAEVSPRECMGALYPTLDQTYQGSGVQDVTWKVLEKPGLLKRAGDGNHYFVDQGVAAFPQNTDRARAFVQASANQWKACTGQTVTVTYTDNSKYTWTVGNLTGEAPNITQSYTQAGGHGYACQRVLSAVSNIVIDVKACGDHITDEASRIVNKIAAGVTHPAF